MIIMSYIIRLLMWFLVLYSLIKLFACHEKIVIQSVLRVYLSVEAVTPPILSPRPQRP